MAASPAGASGMMTSAVVEDMRQTRAMKRISNAVGRRSAMYTRTPPARHVTQILWTAPRLAEPPNRAPAEPDTRPPMPMIKMIFHGAG